MHCKNTPETEDQMREIYIINMLIYCIFNSKVISIDKNSVMRLKNNKFTQYRCVFMLLDLAAPFQISQV